MLGTYYELSSVLRGFCVGGVNPGLRRPKETLKVIFYSQRDEDTGLSCLDCRFQPQTLIPHWKPNKNPNCPLIALQSDGFPCSGLETFLTSEHRGWEGQAGQENRPGKQFFFQRKTSVFGFFLHIQPDSKLVCRRCRSCSGPSIWTPYIVHYITGVISQSLLAPAGFGIPMGTVLCCRMYEAI